MAQLVEAISKPLQATSGKILKGLFAVCNEFNQNGRRYPGDIYDAAYEEIVPKIRERRLLGELDHPIDRDEVFLSNVSHVITECHAGTSKSGKKAYYGTVELLDTPAGKIAQALVQAGIPLGISSRGVGNTKQVSGGVEVTQFKMITYDLVAEPSFGTAILSESKVSELAESLNKIEAKLPLNESHGYDRIRESINNIRTSLKLTEPRVHIDSQKVQTIELNVLKSMLESKTKIIASDTRRLKENRKQMLADTQKIRELEGKLSLAESRYTSIRDNHKKLQESYNGLESEYQSRLDALKESSEAKILELQKRLAVEQRGMSYSKVQTLLESAKTTEEIEAVLDSIRSMKTSSPKLSGNDVQSVRESLLNSPKSQNSLSRIVSRV